MAVFGILLRARTSEMASEAAFDGFAKERRLPRLAALKADRRLPAPTLPFRFSPHFCRSGRHSDFLKAVGPVSVSPEGKMGWVSARPLLGSGAGKAAVQVAAPTWSRSWATLTTS